MLATLVIGLREGLEAALIVGIIAAFLRRNGKSLTAMWAGVVLAVILSIAVGVGLGVIEQGLPQSRQEGMESIIGAIAIFFVTGMIAWMNTHARHMKRQLEAQAAQALTQAGAYALASMAFLAVLKEGFETSVFLLATFSAAQSAVWAASGAIIGLVLAVIIGWGIYVGGVRINLSRFFRLTGAFLILVAAGLVISSLRAAHEAGWLNVAQQTTIDLSGLVTPGTVQSALITGVLGIPADPRLIEVIGWCAYLIPVALFIYWPTSWRPQTRTAMHLQLATATALAAAALGLFLLYPAPRPAAPAAASLVAANDGTPMPVGTAQLAVAAGDSAPTLHILLAGADESTLALPHDQGKSELHDGIDSLEWVVNRSSVPAHAAATLTIGQVIALSGGRTPVGLNPHEHPGPFTAAWSTQETIRIWTADGRLLDADDDSVTVVSLSGGGLGTQRTLTVAGDDPASPGSWRVSTAYRTQVHAALNELARRQVERQLLAIQMPVAMAIVALLFVGFAGRNRIRLRRSGKTDTRHPLGLPRVAH